MKLIEYFNEFFAYPVNLPASSLDLLDARVDSITAALQASTSLQGLLVDTVPQGSWAHRTIIRPRRDFEFDADFLVQLEEQPDWNGDPQKYAQVVYDALKCHGVYGTMTTRKNRCVRVTYANDCHVDVIPYVILGNGRQVIVNRTTNVFEDTDPLGFTAWLQEKDKAAGGNLRKVLRLLKRLRDHERAFDIKSVLLTTLVGNIVESWRAAGADHYKDVPTALVHLVEDLDRWLQMHWTKPSVSDPSCPNTTFDHRWTQNQYEAFRTKIHALAPKLRAAYETEGVSASVTAWQGIFGDSFPSALSPKTASAAPAALTKAAATANRAPGEAFIEDRYPVHLTHRVEVVCEVSDIKPQNRKERRRALHLGRGRVTKNRALLFRVVYTDVAGDYKILWKIRNTGAEAKNRGALRGEIHPDKGLGERYEETRYSGHHYVECFIVKDGTCVARTRQPVIIP